MKYDRGCSVKFRVNGSTTAKNVAAVLLSSQMVRKYNRWSESNTFVSGRFGDIPRNEMSN